MSPEEDPRYSAGGDDPPEPPRTRYFPGGDDPPEPPRTSSQRWRLDLGYDGTAFSGWASQTGRRTVQGELETWLGRVFGSEPPRLVCAGRTDAGVHARGQVAHADLDPATIPDPAAAVRRLNQVLPHDLVVWRLTPAPEGFDARFSAVWRRYIYRLAEPSSPVDPLYRNQVTRLRHDLDLHRLNEAAGTLIGLRNFGAFCRGREGATTIRTLLDLRAVRVPAGPLRNVIECTVRADAFCHSMVRALVGALVEVGSGRRNAGWLDTVAAAATRDPTIPVLAPGGLTLEEVGYPAEAELAERARRARSTRTLEEA